MEDICFKESRGIGSDILMKIRFGLKEHMYVACRCIETTYISNSVHSLMMRMRNDCLDVSLNAILVSSRITEVYMRYIHFRREYAHLSEKGLQRITTHTPYTH